MSSEKFFCYLLVYDETIFIHDDLDVKHQSINQSIHDDLIDCLLFNGMSAISMMRRYLHTKSHAGEKVILDMTYMQLL